MGLRFILGTSGTGKTSTCINEMLSKESGDKNIIYIVPEQFTLEAERALINNFNSKAILKTQVLSFKRLSFHLFAQTGGIDKKLLDREGKTMLLRKLLYEKSSELSFLGRSLDKQGFLENLSNTITEFFQYGITPEKIDLSLTNTATDENLRLKMQDLNTIYKAYLDYIHKEYISTDETLDILARQVPFASMLDNAEIWIDNFNAFTPQEYKVISALMLKADNITITLPLDSNKIDYTDINPFDFYFESKTTIQTLVKLAMRDNIQIEKPLFLSDNLRHKENPELAFLTKNYPSHSLKEYTLPVDNINIISANNLYSEIEEVALTIIKLVRDHSYKYSDIAIILGAKEYEKPLGNILSKYQIPNFLDSKKSILSHPLTELIRSVLDIVISNWSYDSVFRFLKTRLVPISSEDIDTLENYVLAYGIKGYRWQLENWLYGSESATQFNIDDINFLKTTVLETLSPFTDSIKANKKYSVKEISTKIFNLLNSLEVTSTLNKWIAEANQNNNIILAKEHTQIWGVLSSIFDKLVEILGDENVDILEFSKILNSGFSTTEMGLIPPTQEHIIIGNINRTKLPNIKAVFILGVNEGSLPAYIDDSGMFSDFEKDILYENGVEISATNRRRINQDFFAIYSTLVKPSQRLYLSYSTSSLASESRKPSTIIYKLQTLYPQISTKAVSKLTDNISDIINKEIAFSQLVSELSIFADTGEISDTYIDIYCYLKNDDVYKDKLESIEQGLFLDNPTDYLSNDIASKLYGKSLYTSVSKLELFSKCPFSFFMEYGIKAKERKEYEITPPYMGSLFHSILEHFSNSLAENNMDWRSLTKADINTYVNDALEVITPTLGTDILLSSSRFRYMLDRVKRISQRSIAVLSEHIKEGYFNPLGYEIGFGLDESLPPIVLETEDGKKIILRGKIDRVDVFYDAENNNNYIKILDYKSYTTTYDLSAIYYGLQLQLILYLDAFIQKTDILNAIPAGIFYFTIDDPIVSSESGDIDKINEAIFQNFKVRGLLLENDKVLKAIEKETNIEINGDLRKLRTLKSPLLANLEQINSLRGFVNKKVCELGQEMLNGSIKIEPYKKGAQTGCDYCKYSSICRFETLNKATKYKVLHSINKDEIWSYFRDK